MRGRRTDPLAEELGGLELFRGCSSRELRQIAALATPHRVDAGELLMLERFHGEEFHVIADGSVRVVHGDEVVAELGPGSFVGEIGLLEGSDRTATVIAASTTRLLTFSSAQFDELVSSHPAVAERIRDAARRRSAGPPTDQDG